MFGILNTRLTCCENYQIPHTNISKYLLNGHKSEQTIVQTIFRNVQLDINRQNLLIMTGRITKVRIHPYSPSITFSFTHRYATYVQNKSYIWSKKPLGHEMFEERKAETRKNMAGDYGPARRGHNPEAGHLRGASRLHTIQRRPRAPFTRPAHVRIDGPPRQGRAQRSPDRRMGT